jgi:hypothetical protein
VEASADRRILVRKITDVHANYSVRDDGQPGQFSLQLILDDGAEEHLVLPDAEATKVVLRLLRASDTAYFDLEKRIISLARVASGD